MILLPHHLFRQYRSFCDIRGIRDSDFADYLKWLRYFLDFCEKYHVAGSEPDRIDLFLNKLQQKGQVEQKRQQAREAVSLYFAMLKVSASATLPASSAPSAQPMARQQEGTGGVQPDTFSVSPRHSLYNVAGYQANYDIRTIQTKLGHSSLKTTMIYTHCVPVRTVKEARSPLDI
ncbi:phage integrase N-terminal SAM-like domain-containing protein [Geobacter pickeringii]|uniref:Integrase SAM-like N-terminal domain-containing protein n=1 Tax=Geobacter pickeringii TaxID=345632 RepID=A0A0B5B7Z6_9BACT|nr:phage integrase N-terminal SAM-like domain-containing protein [Geobacter pickeringii]AJE02708.1 hypothetical protein GPICK_04385 [Geobacter pickeringii]